MRHLVAVALALGLVAVCVQRAQSNGQNEGDGVQISVAPATIVLDGPVVAVTVHSNLPYGSVVLSSVRLNGVAYTAVWADDCGDLVARFNLAALGISEPGEVTLTLTGVADGTAFAASDTVKVVVWKKK